MISKISLGTVQFGQDYGIANTHGRVSESEVAEILDFAQSVGINDLDTAYAYGVSETVIGKCLRGGQSCFNIVSKLPPLDQSKGKKIEEYLNQSLQRLGTEKLHGYLVHRFEDVLKNDELWNQLVCLRESGQIEKIGFSLYSPEELTALFEKKINFDIVQIPYSIFDRRFERCFDVLKKKGVEIQVRSVFLQGLAFLALEELPASLLDAKPQLEHLQNIAEDQKISIEALCLNFVFSNPYIDKAVIGVDSLAHLKNNVESVNFIDCVGEIYDQLKRVEIESEDILLPYKWGIN